MRAAKLYALIWLFVAAAMLVAHVTESFNALNLIVFGFLCSSLLLMGSAIALRHLLNRHCESKQGFRIVIEKRKSFPSNNER